MKKLILIALACLAGPLVASDAGEHVQKAATEAKAAVVAGTKSASEAVKQAGVKAGQAVQAAGQSVADATKAGDSVAEINPLEALKEGAPKHLHNKIVHFPIALGIFGAIFLLLSFRYPSYKWPARVLLFCAGVFAALALPTGEAMEGAFDGTSLVGVLEAHENAGKIALGLIWGAFLLSFFEVTRKFFWLYALALIGMLVMAGGFGGVLAAS